MNLPTGPNIMTPLSEFVVIERKPEQEPPTMREEFFPWCHKNGISTRLDWDNLMVLVFTKKPTHIELYLEPANGWTIVWQ